MSFVLRYGIVAWIILVVLFHKQKCLKDVVGANVLITNCTHYPIIYIWCVLFVDAFFFFFFGKENFFNNNNKI